MRSDKDRDIFRGKLCFHSSLILNRTHGLREMRRISTQFNTSSAQE